MRVSGIREHSSDGVTEVSAQIDGFTLFYQFSGARAVSMRGDAFLAAALIPAMARGEALEIDSAMPVSPRLLAGVERIQDVLHSWNPKLRKVAIRAEVSPSSSICDDVASFFSGGVDGGYTFLKHADEISILITIQGMEISLDNERLATQVWSKTQQTAQQLGTQCVLVRCNTRELCAEMRLAMALFHGAMLGSIALLLGCRRTYIPSSFPYSNLHPWGSHVLLDPYWTTEGCEIIHDGAEATRPQKLERICQSPELLNALRVCNGNADYNCGHCGKCLRTMIALRLLGVQSEALPRTGIMDRMNALAVNNKSDLAFFQQNYALALQRGDHEMARVLRRCVRRYEIRKFAREFDDVVLGGLSRRMYRRVRPAPPRDDIIQVEPVD
jgi:hypothetical protein